MAWVAGHSIPNRYDNFLRDVQSFCDTRVEIVRVPSDGVKAPKIYLSLSGYRQILISDVSLSSQCFPSDIENNRSFIFVEQCKWEVILPSMFSGGNPSLAIPVI